LRRLDVGYSATDWSPDQLLPALNAVSGAGFSGIEVGTDVVQIFEDRVDEFRSLLDLCNLKLTAVTAGFILTDFAYTTLDLEVARQAIAFAREASEDPVLVAVPGEYGGTAREGVEQAAWALGKIADLAGEAGVPFCVKPTAGSCISRKADVALLMDLTEKRRDRLGLCLDTAHLLLGGCEPQAVIASWPERLWHVHLTDLRINEIRGSSPLAEPGTGRVDLRGITQSLLRSSYEGWVVGRVDTPTRAPRESAVACADYFRKALHLPLRETPAET
jgi:inosose dehydratase